MCNRRPRGRPRPPPSDGRGVDPRLRRGGEHRAADVALAQEADGRPERVVGRGRCDEDPRLRQPELRRVMRERTATGLSYFSFSMLGNSTQQQSV